MVTVPVAWRLPSIFFNAFQTVTTLDREAAADGAVASHTFTMPFLRYWVREDWMPEKDELVQYTFRGRVYAAKIIEPPRGKKQLASIRVFFTDKARPTPNSPLPQSYLEKVPQSSAPQEGCWNPIPVAVDPNLMWRPRD